MKRVNFFMVTSMLFISISLFGQTKDCDCSAPLNPDLKYIAYRNGVGF